MTMSGATLAQVGLGCIQKASETNRKERVYSFMALVLTSAPTS